MGSEYSDDGLTTVFSETFDVGATEVCFPFNFTVSDETVDIKRLKLTIMNGTNMTEVENGSGSMVINIVSKESRKLICRNYCCAKLLYLVYTKYKLFTVPPSHLPTRNCSCQPVSLPSFSLRLLSIHKQNSLAPSWMRASCWVV